MIGCSSRLRSLRSLLALNDLGTPHPPGLCAHHMHTSTSFLMCTQSNRKNTPRNNGKRVRKTRREKESATPRPRPTAHNTSSKQKRDPRCTPHTTHACETVLVPHKRTAVGPGGPKPYDGPQYRQHDAPRGNKGKHTQQQHQSLPNDIKRAKNNLHEHSSTHAKHH